MTSRIIYSMSCQICEDSQDLLDTSDEEQVQIRMKFRAVTNLEDQTSNWLRLIRLICLSCKKKLDELWEFRMICQKAYLKFLTEEINCNVTTKSASNDLYIDSDQEIIEWLDEIDEKCNETKESHQEHEMIEIPYLKEESKETKYANEDLKNEASHYLKKNPDGTPKGSLPTCLEDLPPSERLLQKLRRFSDLDPLHPTSFVCDVCGKSFPMQAQLTKHKKLNHLKKHLNLNHLDVKKFQCHICGKKTIGEAALRVHLQIHTDDRILCLICNRSYNTDNTFHDHFMKYHTDSRKTYKCSFCSIEFRTGEKRKLHERLHTGEKPHKCNMCPKTFRVRKSLTMHINTHTREKTYPCKLCHKEFTSSQNQRIHMRIHTGEKPYECSNCSERFRELRMLKNHCKKCSKTSQNEENEQNDINKNKVK